jgi:tetraacyldisaccharide 4'-kinase
MYSINFLKTTRLSCKVVSVGNISFGGTGKTPFVIALAKELQRKYKIAILSRGYGRNTKGLQLVSNGKRTINDWDKAGDEPILISKHVPDVPIVVDENRINGGKYIVNKFNPDLIILDDAFQHRKIYRDLDVVLIDSSKNRVLQFFREPLGALKRAEIIVLTKVTNGNKLSLWKNFINRYNAANFSIVQTVEKTLIGNDHQKFDISQIYGKSVVLFSGIGNPRSFRNMINKIDCNILCEIIFPDHHKYDNSDVTKIKAKFEKHKPDFVLTTEKDIIKFPSTNLPIFAVPISTNIPKEIIDHINLMM